MTLGYSWNVQHRDRKRAWDRHYRLARFHAERRRIFERDGWRCYYCRGVFVYAELDVDHKQPISRGGDNTDANKVTACRDCNRRKCTKTAVEFLAVIDPDRAWQEVFA